MALLYQGLQKSINPRPCCTMLADDKDLTAR